MKRFLFVPWFLAVLAVCAAGSAIVGTDAEVVTHRGITLQADGFGSAGGFAVIWVAIVVFCAGAMLVPSKKGPPPTWLPVGVMVLLFGLTTWIFADPVGEPTQASVLVAAAVLAAAATTATLLFFAQTRDA